VNNTRKKEKMISDEVYISEMHRLLKARDYLKNDRLMLIKLAMESISIDERDAHLETIEREARDYQSLKKQHAIVPTESYEQKKLVSWFKQEFPLYRIGMVRNDGTRTEREKVEQIALGLWPGMADLYMPHIHTWVEMKRVKKSVVSQEQIDFAQYVTEVCGDIYLLCYGFEDAKKQILEVIKNKAL
jgi:hypothetical protein